MDYILDWIKCYPNAPIYHYGNFDSAAFDKMKRKHKTKDNIETRLININTMIFGKIYFPVYSNSLKSIGKYIGCKWSKEKSTGTQCIAWRHEWEKGEKGYKEIITKYNEEDCYALLKLSNKLTEIGILSTSESNHSNSIDFADNANYQASQDSRIVHDHFNAILKFSHEIMLIKDLVYKAC